MLAIEKNKDTYPSRIIVMLIYSIGYANYIRNNLMLEIF